MRGVVWLILLFTVAVVAATALGRNDGLVTLVWSGWRAELSLNLFIVLMIGACLLLMAALRAVDALLSLPRRASEWRELQRERAAQAALREALAEFFGARYSRAHKAAQRTITIQDDSRTLGGDAELRVLAHLLAAGSLHRLQDRPRRDALLSRIEGDLRSGKARAAAEGASLLIAEWALDDGDADKALALLAALPPGLGRRTQALRLRLRAARIASRPLDALHTARLLAKHQAFSPAATQGLLRSLAIAVLDTARDADQLRRQWQELDPADRRDAAVATRAAQRAVALGAPDDARLWLGPLWDRLSQLPVDERRAVALALCDATPGVGIDWLPRAEGAVAAMPGDPAVAAAAGMVFAERQLWGKARLLLQQAASAPTLQPSARRRALRQLADLARGEGDEGRAAGFDRSAAEIS